MFCIGKDGPYLYAKAIDHLALFTSTRFKNGSDVVFCLRSKKLVKLTERDLPENPLAHEKIVWDFCTNDGPHIIYM